MEAIEQDGPRVLGLEGGFNFRDIGGYETADGRRVREGLVYRSASLSGLTDADHAVLRDLKIRQIVDLRANGERTQMPTRWIPGDEVAVWSRDHVTSTGELPRHIAEGRIASPEAMRARMVASYRTMVREQAPSYAALFRCIAEGQLPLVFHCSAGKDRTGIGTALLLTHLGVPRDVVMRDYLVTGRFSAQLQRVIAQVRARPELATVDEAILLPVLSVDESYLAAMFETLDEDYGGVEEYLRDGLRSEIEVLKEVEVKLVGRRG